MEIQNFFLANFTQTFDPQGMWIGLIIDSGEKKYSRWSEQIENLFEILALMNLIYIIKIERSY